MAERDRLRSDDAMEGLRPLAASPDRSVEELEDQVRGVLLEALSLEVGDAREDLIEGSLIDSLALVELLFALEKRFDLVLVAGALDIESFRSIERIARFVAEQSLGTKP